MFSGHQSDSGKWVLTLIAALLLLFAQFATAAHAAEHLTHDHDEICELFSVTENHDTDIDNSTSERVDFVACKDASAELTGNYFQLFIRHYAVRAPPVI